MQQFTVSYFEILSVFRGLRLRGERHRGSPCGKGIDTLAEDGESNGLVLVELKCEVPDLDE